MAETKRSDKHKGLVINLRANLTWWICVVYNADKQKFASGGLLQKACGSFIGWFSDYMESCDSRAAGFYVAVEVLKLSSGHLWILESELAVISNCSSVVMVSRLESKECSCWNTRFVWNMLQSIKRKLRHLSFVPLLMTAMITGKCRSSGLIFKGSIVKTE